MVTRESAWIERQWWNFADIWESSRDRSDSNNDMIDDLENESLEG